MKLEKQANPPVIFKMRIIWNKESPADSPNFASSGYYGLDFHSVLEQRFEDQRHELTKLGIEPN